MRIIIEDGPASTVAPAASGVVVSSEAENAGSGPTAAGGDVTAGDRDGGGPPQWLLDAVGRTIEAEGAATGMTSDAADGGSGPQEQ
jgi:hypothetical protein